VLGSGVAGLSAAVRATERHGLSVGVLTKAELHQATTRWAQGGVAAALDEDPDAIDRHLADTLAAGAGLCDVAATRVLVDEGPDRVYDLIALGAQFDRDARGEYELATEGGHSEPRILHAGGAATGVEVERALVDATERTAAALWEHSFALDLLIEDGRCVGVSSVEADGTRREILARNVLLATGGAGQLFSVTTNPLESTGDGIAMAARAGVAVADVEFVQFHPTALHHPQMPRPLLSEALRGHGALLRDADGERFVDELQPRDVVSRAMTSKMIDQDTDHLWLDATGLEAFDERFPTIAASLEGAGLDPTKDWLPVAPAAHYLCGGVVTDLDGATALAGLWAAGESACTGVHGANRLASNSLLEGMVFAPRAVEAIARGKQEAEGTGAMRAVFGGGEPGTIGGLRPPADDTPASPPPVREAPAALALRARLQRALTRGAGVLRSAESLAETRAVVEEVAAAAATLPPARDSLEVVNLAAVGRSLLRAATFRRESRGAHTRSDFPRTEDDLRVRIVLDQRPS
jgi:L-aspartate oxidase